MRWQVEGRSMLLKASGEATARSNRRTGRLGLAKRRLRFWSNNVTRSRIGSCLPLDHSLPISGTHQAHVHVFRHNSPFSSPLAPPSCIHSQDGRCLLCLPYRGRLATLWQPLVFVCTGLERRITPLACSRLIERGWTHATFPGFSFTLVAGKR